MLGLAPQVAEARLIVEVVRSLLLPQLKHAELVAAKAFLRDLFAFADVNPDDDPTVSTRVRLTASNLRERGSHFET
jgi:hypothetical protein